MDNFIKDKDSFEFLKRDNLLKYYDSLLSEFKIEENNSASHNLQRLSHLRWMISQMLNPTDPKLKEKFTKVGVINRWLGFIQGTLWSANLVTIQELRDQSRGLDG